MYSKPLLKFDTNEFKPYHISCLISNYVISYLIKKSKKFYPDKIPYTKIQDRWKETDFSGVSDWKELHALLKNSKMKYRIPVPEGTVFKIFSSHKSKVYVL